MDQTAAQMIFAVDRAAGRVCVHLQSEYRGRPAGFAWIIPVPGVPTIGESDPALFPALEARAALRIIPPGSDSSNCPADGPEDEGCGCSGLSKGGRGGGAKGGPQGVEPISPVTIYATVQTKHYEGVVVGAEGDTGADALVMWLQDNGYHFSDNMRPLVQTYVDEGAKFAALSLTETDATQSTAPVYLCYDAAAPAVPLRFAAVAATAMTSLSVTVLGDVTFTLAGGEALSPDPEGIVFDPVTGRTNYFEWVARAADETDGRAWVLDFAGPHGLERALPGAEGGLAAYPWMTHFYTRLGPQHMVADPVFLPGTGQTTREALVDLSTQAGVPACDALQAPSPCFDNYCGLESECVDTVEQVAPHCLCATDRVAQRVLGPDAVTRVTCTPAVNPVGLPDTSGAGGADPCADEDCGEGRCVSKGGFPACVCNAGAGAFVDGTGALRCENLTGEIRRYGPGGGPESAPVVAKAEQGLAPAASHLPAGTPWLGALLAGRWLTRRRRGGRAAGTRSGGSGSAA